MSLKTGKDFLPITFEKFCNPYTPDPKRLLSIKKEQAMRSKSPLRKSGVA